MTSVDLREYTLKTFGFEDMADCHDDFDFIFSHFDDVLALEGVQIGGTEQTLEFSNCIFALRNQGDSSIILSILRLKSFLRTQPLAMK